MNENLNTENKNEELVNYEELENTPFTIAELLRSGETIYVPLIGKYRASEEHWTDKNALINYLNTPCWALINQVIAVFIKEQDKFMEVVQETEN